MKASQKIAAKQKPPTLVGTWFNGDEYVTEVEFIITQTNDGFGVRVRDRFDNEEADIFETAYDGDTLSFAAHWNKTGRLARYKLLLLSANRISVTYTYTDMEMYHRKRNVRKA